MNKKSPIKPILIAYCGMNCAICFGYLRKKNKCPGCRSRKNISKPNSCYKCKIVVCSKRNTNGYKFCFSCGRHCLRLKQLDKRYRTKYNMSMLENLADIKRLGIKKFVKNEIKRWTCKKCGGTICVHKKYCYSCGK
ncbi:MAG: hypothetical protein A2252_02795 [Elusimicrobia bacterium RIFOXYA2_FULL_39_19]|nr:MAG: hypothetical protein A2252_02795 [Elusimicrobia bacterium RIFOXYA2_FULL_39_19]